MRSSPHPTFACPRNDEDAPLNSSSRALLIEVASSDNGASGRMAGRIAPPLTIQNHTILFFCILSTLNELEPKAQVFRTVTQSTHRAEGGERKGGREGRKEEKERGKIVTALERGALAKMD